MPREKITFTPQPKIHSRSQIFRYGRRIFCLPYRPKFSDFFDLCLYWVFEVRGWNLVGRKLVLGLFSLKSLGPLQEFLSRFHFF